MVWEAGLVHARCAREELGNLDPVVLIVLVRLCPGAETVVLGR
jgi:hypothetical protein